MPHYEKAPITEALIDIRVELSSEFRFEDLQAVRKHVSSDYPQEETRNLAEGIIQFGPSLQASAQQKPWGLMFRNESNNQVLQVRLDGFTFSRLAPYEDFEHLRDEARRLWDIYRELVRPKRTTRVAVRYINQLNIPGASVQPEDYLNIFPHVSNKLPPELRDFGPYSMSLRMYQHDLKGFLLLNEVMTPPKLPNTISIVLDFDLYVETPPVTNEQELWSFFDRLRERKNLYFEECITDKTRELIR
jgi:uncharacterized protein (TIGR04255 family)